MLFRSVKQALEAQNTVMSAGFVETPSDRVQLRVTGSFETVKEIRDFPIRVAGSTFRIGDVAEVYRGFNDPPAPRMRYMGSKHRLLPWLHAELVRLDFTSALDAFSGSGAVAWLLKSMGKRVTTNDYLRFATEIARAVESLGGSIAAGASDDGATIDLTVPSAQLGTSPGGGGSG